eukprot:3210699-Karenia_brevis.AAC.1
MENSQNDTFPGSGEADDDSLPSYEEQATGGVDPLTKPGCAQVAASGIQPMAQEVWIYSDEYQSCPAALALQGKNLSLIHISEPTRH